MRFWGNQKVNTRSGRGSQNYAQMLLQLGAYACILALLALAARAFFADVSARAVRQPAAAGAAAVEVRLPAAPSDETWMKAAYDPKLRGGFETE